MPTAPARLSSRPRRRGPRSRRSTEEVIDRIIEAAASEFESNGYTRTTTAAIARKAGVAEALIFTNFGSKARLFHDAIFKPLNQHFLDFCATHLTDSEDPAWLRDGTRQYIAELRRFLSQHAGMLMSLVVARAYECDSVGESVKDVRGLEEYFSRTSSQAMQRLGARPRIDPTLVSRISFATLLGCVLFKDWLFPGGPASDEALGSAISDFVMDGLNANERSPRVRA